MTPFSSVKGYAAVLFQRIKNDMARAIIVIVVPVPG